MASRTSARLQDRVFRELEREADMDGMVIFPQQEIADRIGVVRDSVYSAIQALIADGRLEQLGYLDIRTHPAVYQLVEQ